MNHPIPHNPIWRALFSSALILLTFGGCTLSMEEWILPEEERGVEEPYTVENEFYTLTYQYNEGVKPITKNVLEYFIGAEVAQGDTLLYFSANVPDKYIPEAGGFMQIGVCEAFPMGYYAKVLSRTKANGMICFKTQRADIDDIFQKFDFVSDVTPDISTEDEGDDDNQPRAAHAPALRIDYSLCADQYPELYARQKAHKWGDKAKAQARRIRASRAKTRGGSANEGGFTPVEGSGNQGENEPSTNDEVEKTILKFKLSTKEGVSYYYGPSESEKTIKIDTEGPMGKVWETVMDKLTKRTENAARNTHVSGKVTPILEYEYRQETTTTFHTEYYKERDYSLQKQIERKTTSSRLNLGIEAELKDTVKADLMREINKGAKEALDKMGGKDVNNLTLADFKSTLIAVAPQFGVFLSIKPEAGLEFTVSGIGTLEWGKETVETTTIVEKEGDKDEKMVGKPTKKTISQGDNDFSFTGTLAVDVYAAVDAGIILAGAVHLGVTIKGSFGFAAKRSPAQYITPKLNDDEYFSEDSYFQPILDISVDAWGGVGVMGNDFIKTSHNLFYTNFLKDYKLVYHPTFPKDVSNQLLTIDKTSNNSPLAIQGRLKFQSMGLAPYRLHSRYDPRIFVYEYAGSYNDFEAERAHYVFDRHHIFEIGASNHDGFMESGKTYEFFKSTTIPTNTSSAYILVPVLWDKVSKQYIVYRDYARVVEPGDPRLELANYMQTKGRKANVDEWRKFGVKYNTTSGRTYYIYEVDASFKLTGATHIKKIGINSRMSCNKTSGRESYHEGANSITIDKNLRSGYLKVTMPFLVEMTGGCGGTGFNFTISPYFIDADGFKYELSPQTLFLEKELGKDKASNYRSDTPSVINYPQIKK